MLPLLFPASLGAGRCGISYSAWASALLVLDEMGNARRPKQRDERQFSNPRFFVSVRFSFLLFLFVCVRVAAGTHKISDDHEKVSQFTLRFPFFSVFLCPSVRRLYDS